jgi:predicted transcriptional regulator
MGRYRSRLEIVADVLSVVSDGARKTQIMYQANLSYKLLIQYLKDVLEAGLVRSDSDDFFRLTRKGVAFLRHFKRYHERRQKLGKQLRGIKDEKVMLENRFLNAETMDVSSKNCSSKKGETKKKKAA